MLEQVDAMPQSNMPCTDDQERVLILCPLGCEGLDAFHTDFSSYLLVIHLQPPIATRPCEDLQFIGVDAQLHG